MNDQVPGAEQVRSVLLLCWRDSDHPQGGGSERYLERVAAELAADGLMVTLRTAGYPGAPAREERDGYTISRGGGRFTVYPRALGAMLAARVGRGPLAGAVPDVVIDTQNGVPFFARWAGRPTVVLVHHCHRAQWPVAGRLVGRIGWFIESRLAPAVYRRSQYLTVSVPSRADLIDLGIDGDRIAIARGGLDAVPVNLPAPRHDALRLCVLSRLVPHKQIEHALTAVARLRHRHPGIALDVVGDGWWHDELVSRASELGISDRVTFHGRVSEFDKYRLLGEASALLMPSRTEGWGLAVIEAAQRGVPTIGYRSSRGLTDSVESGVTGLLVDDLDEFISATEQLLDEPARARSLGMAARTRAEGYSWPDTATAVRRVIDAAATGQTIQGVVAASDDAANHPVPAQVR